MLKHDLVASQAQLSGLHFCGGVLHENIPAALITMDFVIIFHLGCQQ
jgi:hypothetical protein